MEKLITASIVTIIISLGFIMNLIDLYNIIKRTNFTNQYHKKFIELVEELFSNKTFNNHLYYELTLEVKAMQYELGSDGIYACITDKLKGFTANNYQVLINFLPELKHVIANWHNSIMMDRYIQSAQDCDDMFIRHMGTLKNLEKAVRKRLINPLCLFSDGMKFVISLPVLMLNWLGVISDKSTRKIRQSKFIKVINSLGVIVGLISAIFTIVLGWNDFLQLISKLFNRTT